MATEKYVPLFDSEHERQRVEDAPKEEWYARAMLMAGILGVLFAQGAITEEQYDEAVPEAIQRLHELGYVLVEM